MNSVEPRVYNVKSIVYWFPCKKLIVHLQYTANKVCSVQITEFSVQIAVFSLQIEVFSVQIAVFSVQYAF